MSTIWPGAYRQATDWNTKAPNLEESAELRP